jgi:hypothetical protein
MTPQGFVASPHLRNEMWGTRFSFIEETAVVAKE